MLPRILKTIAINKTATLISVFLLAVFCIITIFFIPELSFAQDYGLSDLDQTIDLPSTDIRIIIGRIIRAVLGLLGIIALSLVLYAGFMIMTSGGNEEKVTKGRKILINAVIGLIIILSSFAIVQFVLNSLDKAIRGDLDSQRIARQIGLDSFSGTGGLGRIVKDHYPFRDEKNIPRNARIIVTFADPIRVNSLINDENNDGVFGNCVVGGVCDTANSSVRIFTSTSTRFNNLAEEVFLEASALTTYNAQGEANTFVFKPNVLLGSAEEPVEYTVVLTNDIISSSTVQGIFEGSRSDYYSWDFETGTTADFDPPQVLSVFPKDITTDRNDTIQINFNEPVDPTSVQGIVSSTSNFSNIIFKQTASLDAIPDNKKISGEWRITNGYKTVEFMSDQECGLNSCGEMMYCLPVICQEKECIENYEILIRTAKLIDGAEGFEAVPFSGVMDIAGNALDGNKNGRAEDQPVKQGDFKTITEVEKIADNYWWIFNIRNNIDRSLPQVYSISPSVDAEAIPSDTPLLIVFNKRMQYMSLDKVGLEEFGSGADGIDEIWYRFLADNINENGVEKTRINMRHREFGPNGMSLYYFPTIPSTVKSSNQNCLYPGNGPVENICNAGNGCLYSAQDVPRSNEDTGCMTKNANVVNKVDNVLNCLTSLQDPGVSP